MNLILHVEGNASNDSAAATAHSKAAAQAMLDAHIELRQAFHNVLVFTDVAGHAPLVTEANDLEYPLVWLLFSIWGGGECRWKWIPRFRQRECDTVVLLE